jgi:hypothetical protein
MALPKAMFASDAATSVQMGAPLDCVFLIRPLKPKLRAKWEKRKGLAIEGFAESGDSRTVRATFDSEKDLDANIWLIRQLVSGWDGLKTEVDGAEEPLPFTDENLTAIACRIDLFNAIFEKAEELDGKRRQAEEEN